MRVILLVVSSFFFQCSLPVGRFGMILFNLNSQVFFIFERGWAVGGARMREKADRHG